MALAFEARDADAGHLRDQRLVQQAAEHEEHRTGDDRRHDGADVGAEHRADAERRERVPGEVHAEHQQVALAEIDDAHDAEDDPEADAHQAVERRRAGCRRPAPAGSSRAGSEMGSRACHTTQPDAMHNVIADAGAPRGVGDRHDVLPDAPSKGSWSGILGRGSAVARDLSTRFSAIEPSELCCQGPTRPCHHGVALNCSRCEKLSY